MLLLNMAPSRLGGTAVVYTDNLGVVQLVEKCRGEVHWTEASGCGFVDSNMRKKT